MKRLATIGLILVMALQVAATVHTYAPVSVLNTGNWIKIRVSETGVYSLSYDEIKSMGLQPENIRVYGFGGNMLSQDFRESKIDDLPAVPIYMEKGADGVFGSGDYILFYGRGSFSWQYKDQHFAHKRNPYSDYGYYMLTDNAGEQKFLSQPTVSGLSHSDNITNYTYYDVHERDSFNLLDPSNGVDGGGCEWYGERFTNKTPNVTITFPVTDLVAGSNIRYSVDLASKAYSIGIFTLSANNKTGTITTSAITPGDHYTMGTGGKGNLSVPATKDEKHSITISYNLSQSGGAGYLNYVEMEAVRELKMTGSYMPFRTTTGYTVNTNLTYALANANANTCIWDITHPEDIQAVPCEADGTTLRFTGNNKNEIHEYVAVDVKGSNWLKPEVMGKINNQNLHSLKNIDYVIITPEAFLEPAQRLAQKHEQKQGITWAVVTDQQVYNEFSSGTPDATAYRWMMKMLYDRATSQAERPKWLLLMGDGTFDNRKLLPNSGENMLLTYQALNSLKETEAYATDDYYGYLSDNNGITRNSRQQYADSAGRLDIGIGRLPVITLAEANATVDKICRYMDNDSYGNWKQQILFLADDGNNGQHTETAEGGAEKVRIKNPDFIVNKVYLDAYPQEVNAAGESYPLAKNRLDNLLREGVLFFDYSGHGGYNNITNEGMLSLADIQKMSNKNLAFWMFATCGFGHFDSGKRCCSEEALLNPNGGAIGVFAACRTVYAQENTLLNRHLCDTLFGHKDVFSYDMTIGDAVRAAKNRTGDAKPNNINRLPYNLMGDPAVRLNFPTDMQVKTTTKLDTLNALTIHEVEGYIETEDHEKADWFNGLLHVTIYDKLQQITTRDNDETNPNNQRLLTYNDYPGTIYSGDIDVEDGAFKYTFMTPKDIRYNYGKGRIVYYAYDEVEKAEAVGHFEDFYIGGSSGTWLTDTVGPEMRLYLNSPAFLDGDKTYETPRFFAELEDENGINMAGSGIGHDLTLMVDNNPNMLYVLNSYFRAEKNDFRRGTVSYMLPELADGEHLLTFRAWDLLNNSTTKSIRCIVEHGLDPVIHHISGHIQEDELHIDVDYDQPDIYLSTDIYIYDVHGQLIYTQNQNGPENIHIDLQNLGLAPGLYIYSVRLKSETSHYVSKAGKIVIL